jgi:Chaperone of endosialidase
LTTDNVALGFSAGANNGSLPLDYSTAIGTYSTVTTSNTMVFGARNYTTKWAFGRSTTDYALQVGNDTNDGNGAFLTKGGAWTNSSSRAFKDNFEELSNSEILSKLSQLNIQKWKYKGTDETHIGPIAEEFKELFNLGVKGDNEHIGTIDTSGIALKAIQALMEEIKVLKEKISELEKNR